MPLVALAVTLLAAPSLDAAALAHRISAIDKASQGRLGVGVKDLSSGQTWYLRDEERFTMQSVFKLPLGVAVLHSVDKGELSLDTEVHVTANDLSTPWSVINKDFTGPKNYSVRELLRLAVGESDNTAADLLMKKVGGPKRVMSILRGLGIQGVRIDRYEREFQMQSAGLPAMKPEWANEEVLAKAMEAVPEAKRRSALAAYMKDPRDTSTPAGMVDLLTRLQAGRLLSKTSTQHLLTVMTQSGTGANRLRAALPKGASVAHKTGTGRRVFGVTSGVNDVGIVTLPNGRRVIVVVFLTGSTATYEAQDKTIAEVGRAVIESAK